MLLLSRSPGLLVIFFAVIVAAVIDVVDNEVINKIMSNPPIVEHSTHYRGKLGMNGRFAPFLSGERLEDDAEIIVRDALRKIGFQSTQWEIVSRYLTKNNGVTHITMRQQIGGLTCSNCLLVCNVNSRGMVINLAYTAHVIEPISDFTPSITPRAALAVVLGLWNKTLPKNLESKGKKFKKMSQGEEQIEEIYIAASDLSPEDVSISLKVIANGTKAELAWHVEWVLDQPFHMYEAWVKANPATGMQPQILQIIDLVNWDTWEKDFEQSKHIDREYMEDKKFILNNASITLRKSKFDGEYEVYGIPHLDPTLGSRVLRSDVDERASPLGWHDQGDGSTYTVTVGNNVCAQDNPTGSGTRACIDTYRPDGGTDLIFKFDFDQFADPTKSPTLDAAITNLFYWHNIHHDIFYNYGFDEPAGNFQENNFGKGGIGGDSVQANAQDGAGFNNANFATPVDGQRPRCRMYLWNRHTPYKDGDFDSGIIVHEIGHGVSNRLTGGASVSGCLPSGQSGGMGEGWSDWWAIQFIQEERYRPNDAFPMGDYVTAGGIRNYPYSYDMDINPATFSYLSRSGYTGVHAIGSVWCGILHDVYWDMRASFGFSPNWYDPTSGAGNIVLFQNVLNGLKLQPCRPTFLDARDAILLADEQNYGGRHSCTMWCGFARRGLGVSATTTGYQDRNPVEAFDYPTECICDIVRALTIGML